MTVGQLLDSVRERYVTDLVGTFRRVEAESGAELVREPALRTVDGAVARDGPWALPCRLDASLVRGGAAYESIRVDAKQTIAFSPIEFEWGPGMAVSLHPFQWDYCHLYFSPAAAAGGPLQHWFADWFDADDKREVSPEGVQGVVHFLSDLAIVAGEGHVVIDFGSAPVEAFEEVLDALAESGVATVRVGAQ